MSLNVYLNFNGNCREAIEFYAEAFGAEMPKIMTYGEAPSQDFPISEESKNLVLHAMLKIKESVIMFSDASPGNPVVMGDNMTLVYNSKDMEEIKSIFNKLKTDGNVIMDLQETFWSKCFGSLTDKFGVVWNLSHES